MPDQDNKSAKDQNQGSQSERQRGEGSDNDTYKRSVTGYDASKQDENLDGTMKISSENTIDERDTNDGDANNENNY